MDDGQIAGLKIAGTFALVYLYGELCGWRELRIIERSFDKSMSRAERSGLKRLVETCDEHLYYLDMEIKPDSIRPIYRISGYLLRRQIEKVREGLIVRL